MRHDAGMTLLRPLVLILVAFSLSGCLAVAAVGAVGAVAGTAVGVTAKGVGMAAGAVIPGGGDDKKR